MSKFCTVVLVGLAAVASPAEEGRPLLHPLIEAISPLGLHRGGAKWMPEHTLAAYGKAWEKWPGALLEADVRVTVDGVPILHHDASLDRTTEATGPIEALTLGEVKALDAGYRFTRDGGETFPYRGQGLTIATLEEALVALPEAVWLLEAKPSPGVVEAMVEVIRRVDAEERVVLASFEPRYMTALRDALPRAAYCFDLQTGIEMLLALREGGEAWEVFEPTDHVLAVMQVFIRQFSVQPEEVAAIRAKGVFVQHNTIDTPEGLEAVFALGADGVLTDRPDVVAPWLHERLGLSFTGE